MYITRYTPPLPAQLRISPYIPYIEYMNKVQSIQPVQFTNSREPVHSKGTIAYDYKIELAPKAYTLDILA